VAGGWWLVAGGWWLLVVQRQKLPLDWKLQQRLPNELAVVSGFPC
jgi:hypothetical protein